MKAWQKILTLMVIGLGLIALNGCEDEESNDLAKAQKCMDNISSANYADAAACFDFVAKYDSQQANILKCSIKFLQGGLTTDRVVNAYKALATATVVTSNEAVFMTALALDPSSLATDAEVYCEKSGLKGLIYLANLAVVGSTLFDIGNAIGGTYDPNDPSAAPPSDAEVAAIVADCVPGGPETCGGIPGGYDTIGASVITLSESYCTGSNATSEVCTTINAAIADAGGDPGDAARALFCILDGNSGYDPVGDACIP
jgi:hypothetical protein